MNNIRNIICGLCEILDGLIRVLTFGFVHTRFAFEWLCWWERKFIIPNEIKRMKDE